MNYAVVSQIYFTVHNFWSGKNSSISGVCRTEVERSSQQRDETEQLA